LREFIDKTNYPLFCCCGVGRRFLSGTSGGGGDGDGNGDGDGVVCGDSISIRMGDFEDLFFVGFFGGLESNNRIGVIFQEKLLSELSKLFNRFLLFDFTDLS